MAKYMGFSAATQNIRYIRDNAQVLYLADVATYTAATIAANAIVSANVSSADFTIASAAAGATLTVGAKNSQPVEGSGNATHLYLTATSGSRILLVTTVSSQVLASGNQVNIASWTVTALASANNA